ncbi:hypothetical protein AN958_04917 [Leucoagaricus sp. SymC.cos]|nr:hypothetical protein AN958_04917 [Leucoagaricus sp. SymC.cos]
MDDEFFASVLKKWAESSQEVVDLKKRLGEVELEVSLGFCDLYPGTSTDRLQLSLSETNFDAKWVY